MDELNAINTSNKSLFNVNYPLESYVSGEKRYPPGPALLDSK